MSRELQAGCCSRAVGEHDRLHLTDEQWGVLAEPLGQVVARCCLITYRRGVDGVCGGFGLGRRPRGPWLCPLSRAWTVRDHCRQALIGRTAPEGRRVGLAACGCDIRESPVAGQPTPPQSALTTRFRPAAMCLPWADLPQKRSTQPL